MEKIKINKTRVFILQNSIFVIVEMLFLFFNKPPKFSDIYICIFIVLVFWFYATFENKKINGIYFSKEKISITDTDNYKLDIPWDDLEVDSISFKFWVISLSAYKIKSKTRSDINARFELNWLLETSALPKIKKYAPADHDLYRVVEEYAKRRNLVF